MEDKVRKQKAMDVIDGILDRGLSLKDQLTEAQAENAKLRDILADEGKCLECHGMKCNECLLTGLAPRTREVLKGEGEA